LKAPFKKSFARNGGELEINLDVVGHYIKLGPDAFANGKVCAVHDEAAREHGCIALRG
jgi:hypothetical protein